MAINRRRNAQRATGVRISSTDMESRSTSSAKCLSPKAGFVRYVGSHRRKGTIGGAPICMSTIAIKRERSAGCCVTYVTLPRDTLRPVPPPLALLNTSEFTSERIRAIEPAGRQDVFDLEVADTGSFIANGMVTHNTAWHEDDLIGRILARRKEMDFRVRCITLQALRDSADGTKDPLRREDGEALWPERWPAEVLERRRKAAGHWWYSIYQGRPRGSGLAEFPPEYFQGIIAQEDEWPEDWPILAVTYLDPSLGKNSRKGDYSALVWVGFKNGLLWVDSSIERRPVPRMVREWVEFNRERKPALTGCESNAFQELLAPDYLEACDDIGYYGPEPQLVHNSISKGVRIRRLGKWLHSRLLRFRNTVSNDLLIRQLKAFPDATSHDDGPDALEGAIRLLMSRIGGDEMLEEVQEVPI